MATLTPDHVLLIAVIGGCVAALVNNLLRLIWRGLCRLFEDYLTWRDARRIRRHHLETCRAIDALGTTTEHTKD